MTDKPQCVLPERVARLKMLTVVYSSQRGLHVARTNQLRATGLTMAEALLALEAELEKREGM